MARRAIWNGAISFGMVGIPIKLFPATRGKSFSFVSLHESCKSRLRQLRFCPKHEVEVPLSEVVKGYEYSKDQFVVVEDSDLAALAVPSTHTIQITQFVELSSIDPVYFDKSYTLQPESVGEKAFFLLRKALEESGRVALAKVSVRQKEHFCCVRPYENGLIMATMHYPDEVIGNDELNLPEEIGSITDEELAMANTLIDNLTKPIELEEQEDAYRLEVEKLIEAKLNSTEPIVAAPAPVVGQPSDLMAALKASIQASKNGDTAKESTTTNGKAAQKKAAKPKARRKATAKSKA